MIPEWSVLNILLVSYCNGLLDSVTERSLYAYCDQSFPYCYYSDGEPLVDMSTSEADLFCQSVNENGRLLDFAEVRELNKVKTFMANYSLHKVLLNAINENGVWKWVQQGNDVVMNNNLTTKGMQLFYMLQPGNSTIFHVVCKKDCRSNWIQKEKVSGGLLNTLKFVALDVNSCQELCEVNLTCVGIDWDPTGSVNCGLVFKVDYVENLQITHYSIDRSVKTVTNCIGLIKEKRQNKFPNSTHPFATKKIPEKTDPRWTTKQNQSFPVQIEPAQLIAMNVAANSSSGVNASVGNFKTAFLEQPWVTYLVFAFIAAAIVMVIVGVCRRKGGGESSSEDEE